MDWKNTVLPREGTIFVLQNQFRGERDFRRIENRLIKRLKPQRRRSEQSSVYILIPVEILLWECFRLISISSRTALSLVRVFHLTFASSIGGHNVPCTSQKMLCNRPLWGTVQGKTALDTPGSEHHGPCSVRNETYLVLSWMKIHSEISKLFSFPLSFSSAFQ